jgi:hypothetical protein
MIKKEGNTFNYQGHVELSISNAADISSIALKNIESAENKNGTLTVHKGGKKDFDPTDVKNIESELQNGIKYGELTFKQTDIARKDQTAVIDLQYLIIGVDPAVKKEEVKRAVKMEVLGYDSQGQLIADKNIEVTIP